MTGLVDAAKRERARQARAEGCLAIKRAAIEEFAAAPYDRVTLATLAARAGVPTGTAELIFAGKEEVFLAIVADRVRSWCDNVVATLDGRSDLGPEELAETLAASVARDGLLPRLVTLLPGAVESVREPAVLLGFTNRGTECLRDVRAAIVRSCPTLSAGKAAILPLYLFILTAGLAPLARPAAGMAAALAGTDLAGLGLDLETELASLLRRWLA